MNSLHGLNYLRKLNDTCILSSTYKGHFYEFINSQYIDVASLINVTNSGSLISNEKKCWCVPAVPR
jgi:hypothetical protein